MVRRFAWIILLLALPLASSARAEVPLDKLTTQLVRARLKDVFEDEKTKPVIDKLLAKAGVPFAVSPDEIEYSFVAGKPRLVWRYLSPAPLRPEEAQKVLAALREVLVEALVQVKVDGKGLVTAADGEALSRALEVEPAAPPAGNTPPTISRIADVTINAGETGQVRFTVNDKETPPAQLRIAALSSDPALLPLAQLVLGGEGKDRELKITPAAGKSGSATVTVTATDAGGLSAASTFGVKVLASTKPPGGSSSPSTPAPAPAPTPTPAPAPAPATSYVLVPCVVWDPCCCGPYCCYYYYVAVAAAPAPAPVVAAAPPAAAPTPSREPAGRVVSAPPANTRRPDAPAPVQRKAVVRKNLLTGRKDGNWEVFYNPGYRAYWAGNYTQAVEFLAAAADRGDDPRAWSFLALALLADGDEKAGREAARYAAARLFLTPRLAEQVNEALSRVQGPLRSQLRQFQSEVSEEQTAKTVLAARPKLFLESTPDATTGTTANRGTRVSLSR
jgi:hypothetical protein